MKSEWRGADTGRLRGWVLLGFGLLVWGLCVHATAKSTSWQGTVTYVTDGDTLWVRPSHGGAPHKIRLDGIDAPELCQTYGQFSRNMLATHVMGKVVHVKVRRLDTYGRSLAHVGLNGQDIGTWMVQQGGAWSYRYRRDPGPYAHQEAQARLQHQGLFTDAQPERPRDFRLRHGSCH
jgi:micrococcal nuclease